MSAKNAKTTQGATTPDSSKLSRIACMRGPKQVPDCASSADGQSKRVSEVATIYKARPAADGQSRARERTVTVTPRTTSVQLSARLGCVVVMSPKKSPSVSRRTIQKAVERVAGKRAKTGE